MTLTDRTTSDILGRQVQKYLFQDFIRKLDKASQRRGNQLIFIRTT